MGRRCKNQVWDGRTNIVTVAPAEPSLTQSAETAIVISRLLIIALGILWILLLLIIGGALGVEAASAPVTGATHTPRPTLAIATDGSSIGATDDGNMIGTERDALLGQALGWHTRGEFGEAAAVYTRLLEVVPNDPDGLHLLGALRFSQGKLLDNNPERIDNRKAHFKEAERLVKSAISSAMDTQTNTFSMRGNLGEILRAKGDLEEAVVVLRNVIQEEEDEGIRDHKASFNLAVTLVEIIREADSSPRGHSEIYSKYLSEKTSMESIRGSQGWELRLEAQHLLLRGLSKRPDDKRAMLELAALFMSNWNLDRNAGKGSVGNQSGFNDEGGGLYYDQDGNIIEGFFDDSVDGVMDGHGWKTRTRRDWGEEAVSWLDRAVALDPSDSDVALRSAVALHRLGRTEEARARYIQILNSGAESGHTRDFARSNLAVLQQESGDIAGAIDGYREVLAASPESVVALNNLGAGLYALHQWEEGTAMLEKALQLDPLNSGVMENLGIHWQEEGDLDRARSLYARADEVKRNDGRLVRRAIMLPPIMVGEQEIAQEKENLATMLDDLIAQDPPLVIHDPPRGVERIHFYLVYRGGNHRAIQEKFARVYTLASPGLLHISPSLESKDDYTEPHAGVLLSGGGVSMASGSTTAGAGASKTEAGGSAETSTQALADSSTILRVGFVSLFFGAQEPHGMLLEGVVRHLPRMNFHVTVCPIHAPGRELSPRLADAADEVVRLPSKLDVARKILEGLRLDVLVYADMNSEPISHFLGYARLARVQAVFWGNPITTGNPSIDYFVSAEVMEGQHRTALSKDDETYSEQVVLLGGQGIWYERPTGPGLGDLASGLTPETSKAILKRELTSRLGVREDSVIFMCPQSLFKLKPDYDLVLRDILLAFDRDSNSNQSPESAGTGPPPQEHQHQQKNKPKAYLVLTEGRRKRWTQAIWGRLQRSVPEIIPQVRMLPRTPSGRKFHMLLASADVILHPFPFGGSKTAADGIALGLPVVAMEGDALPGRMAFSLYKTMGLDGPADRGCCVAKDRDSYVQLAIRLGRDARYRRWVGELIGERSAVLWERSDVVFEWARFLSRAGGRPSPTAQEVGLVPGADLPLPPPEPFQAQEHTQPIVQDHNDYQQLSQPPPNPASQSEILQLSPVPTEAALQPPPSRLLTGLPTNSPKEISTEKGRPEATPTTRRSYSVDVDGVTATSLAAAGVSARASTRPIDQADYNVAANTAGDDYHGADESRHAQAAPPLLGQFAMLHREGRLEEAAATLQQALGLMESQRRKTAVRGKPGPGPLQDTALPGGSSVFLELEGRKAPHSGAKDAKGVQPGASEDRRSSENGSTAGSGAELGREVADGDGFALESVAEASAIAGVMNDLGCTLQQLWRLEEAETMLRGAIQNRPGYSAAMASLGVTLQAKNQLDEAESWYREALRLSPLEERDSALTNLVLLMRAGGDRLHEAVDLIIRETSTPPLRRGGAIIAVLSLLQPRPSHRQTFRKLGEAEGWSKRFGRSSGVWEDVRRLRELYPLSINNLVVFLGLMEGLGGVFDVLRDVAGMEPLFFPEDEQALLPPELHPPPKDSGSTTITNLEPGRPDDKPIGGGDGGGHGSGGGGGGGEEEENGIEQRRQRRGKLPYDRHSVHVVTQYYIPDDPSRAREIDACLLHNLQNPFVGTVHIFVDHPDAARLPADLDQNDSAAVHGSSSSWVETGWKPPVLEGLEDKLAGKAVVMRLLTGRRRMTFREAIRYSNHVLSDRVVLMSNSDTAFDESLARLGDPASLDMIHKVFALAAWQSKLVPVHDGDHPTNSDVYGGAVVGTPKFSPRTDSQDAWIFRSPLPSTVADAADFEMGRPRCDGRLAQVLLDAGYSVTSPSLSLVARHVHAPSRSASPHHGPSASNYSSPSSRTSTYRGDTQVAGSIASVPISDQWLF